MTRRERVRRLMTVEFEMGSAIRRARPIELQIAPDYFSLPRSGASADTEQRVLFDRFPGWGAACSDLPQAIADDIAAGRADPELLIHRWPHWTVTPEILPQGATDVHSAFLGGLINRDTLDGVHRSAWHRGVAMSYDTPHRLYMASIASSTGPAMSVQAGVRGRQVLDGGTRGGQAWQSLLAIWPDLADGADANRLAFRTAVAYGTVLALDALTLAVDQHRELNFPALGRLTRSPYNEVLLVSAGLGRAETIDELVASTKLVSALIADRARGVGRLLEGDSARRGGSHCRPEVINGRLQSRIFGVPVAAKVTLDRLALARIAARRATVTFLTQLMTTDGPLGASLHTRLLGGNALAPDRLNPDGGRLRPSTIDWRPRAAPPSTDDLVQLRREAERVAKDAIAHWDREHRDRLERAIDATVGAVESERLAAGGLDVLADEYRGLAEGLAAMIERLEDDVTRELDAARHQLDDWLADPLGKIFLGTIFGPLVAPGRLRKVALRYARAAFRSHRVRAVLAKLDEWRRHYQVGTGDAARAFLDELNVQLDERGAYRRAAFGGWEQLRHPAPTITRLFCSEAAFAPLYYDARVLERRLPSGHVELLGAAFAAAAGEIRSAIPAALTHGRDGVAELAAACEAYFAPRFGERWAGLHLSTAPGAEMEAALEEAGAHLDPRSLVERRSSGDGETFYCELPADDPDRERLRTLVVAATGRDLQWREERREHESAIILFGLQAGLALDDIVPLRRESPARAAFLRHLEAFHSDDGNALPVMASAWLERLVAEYDPEVRAILERCSGCPTPRPPGDDGPVRRKTNDAVSADARQRQGGRREGSGASSDSTAHAGGSVDHVPESPHRNGTAGVAVASPPPTTRRRGRRGRGRRP